MIYEEAGALLGDAPAWVLKSIIERQPKRRQRPCGRHSRKQLTPYDCIPRNKNGMRTQALRPQCHTTAAMLLLRLMDKNSATCAAEKSVAVAEGGQRRQGVRV